MHARVVVHDNRSGRHAASRHIRRVGWHGIARILHLRRRIGAGGRVLSGGAAGDEILDLLDKPLEPVDLFPGRLDLIYNGLLRTIHPTRCALALPSMPSIQPGEKGTDLAGATSLYVHGWAFSLQYPQTGLPSSHLAFLVRQVSHA